MLSLKKLFLVPNVVQRVYDLMKDPENMEAFGRTLPYKYYQNMIDYNRKHPDDDLYYAVMLKDSFAGYVKLDRINLSNPTKQLRYVIPEHELKSSGIVSIYLTKEARDSKSGIGSFALREIIKIGLFHNIYKIFASIYETNERSIRFFSKHSFREIARSLASSDPSDDRRVVIMVNVI